MTSSSSSIHFSEYFDGYSSNELFHFGTDTAVEAFLNYDAEQYSYRYEPIPTVSTMNYPVGYCNQPNYPQFDQTGTHYPTNPYPVSNDVQYHQESYEQSLSLSSSSPMTIPSSSYSSSTSSTHQDYSYKKTSLTTRKQAIKCHMNSKCSNCSTRQTSLWRRSATGDVECNACNRYFAKTGKNRPREMWKNGPIMKRIRKPRL